MAGTKGNATALGWIGAGRMGYAMVARIAGAGEDIAVWNRTVEKAEQLRKYGATVADSIAALRDREVVFTNVSTAAVLKEVLLGEGGLLAEESSALKVLVDFSTVSPQDSADIRAACAAVGVEFLAAPVSGNAKVVEAGRLTIAVSGAENTFNAVEHLLAHVCQTATYVGEGDVSRLVKIAHNLLLGVVTQSLAEITVLAQKGGVPRSAFLNFLNNSVMGSPFTTYKTAAFVDLDYTPTFTPVLLRKDFDLGLAAARELEVPMPVASVTAALVQASVNADRNDEDFAILLDLQAAASGIALEPENQTAGDGAASQAKVS
jgi:3-hydroxyisobutyrate dehydrogenase